MKKNKQNDLECRIRPSIIVDDKAEIFVAMMKNNTMSVWKFSFGSMTNKTLTMETQTTMQMVFEFSVSWCEQNYEARRREGAPCTN